jgi:hypothetical protein
VHGEKKEEAADHRQQDDRLHHYFLLCAHRRRYGDKSYDPEQQARIELNAMRFACNEALLKKLPDPRGAQLDEYQQWAAQPQQDGSVLVQPTGRVRNESGASIVSEWNCRVKNDGVNITVVSLEKRGP